MVDIVLKRSFILLELVVRCCLPLIIGQICSSKLGVVRETEEQFRIIQTQSQALPCC